MPDGFADIMQLFADALLGEDAGLLVDLIEPLDAVLDFPIAHQVEASVAYAGEEEGFCGIVEQLVRAILQELCEDVVHDIFTFGLIV